MIHFIKGKLHSVFNKEIVVEAGGIGYEINVPLSVLPKLPGRNEEVFIYTYYQVKDDTASLFGFLTKEELNMFNMLISVSGIGPKSALGILSEITPRDLMMAIISDDLKTMGRLPGVGKKTAARLVLELKDKIKTKDAVYEEFAGAPAVTEGTGPKNDAVDVLIALGYSRSESFKTVLSLWEDGMTAEEAVKLALKALAANI